MPIGLGSREKGTYVSREVTATHDIVGSLSKPGNVSAGYWNAATLSFGCPCSGVHANPPQETQR